MYCDIVFPDNNEKEFLEMAGRLGYGALVFAYHRPMPRTKRSLKTYNAAVIDDGCRNRPGAEILIAKTACRALIERLKPDIVYEMEQLQKRDFMRQRNSGLNHIICAFAAKHEIAVAFSFSSIIRSKTIARTLGRMRQNISLCRKYRTPMMIASFAASPYEMRAPSDLISLFVTLGMHPKEAGEAMQDV